MSCVALVFGGSGVPTSLGCRSTNNMAEANIPMLFDFRVFGIYWGFGSLDLLSSHHHVLVFSVLFGLGHVMGKRNCYYWGSRQANVKRVLGVLKSG